LTDAAEAFADVISLPRALGMPMVRAHEVSKAMTSSLIVDGLNPMFVLGKVIQYKENMP
jgi:hypothetical protein